MAQTTRTGPLHGIKIIELAGIGPSPYTSMMLADAGAQVIRLERAAPGAPERAAEATRSHWDLLNRSRPSVGIDLKHPEAVELVLNLIEQADPHFVVIFGADHIYRMNIREMLEFHMHKRAQVTIASIPVEKELASEFGVIEAGAKRR